MPRFKSGTVTNRHCPRIADVIAAPNSAPGAGILTPAFIGQGLDKLADLIPVHPRQNIYVVPYGFGDDERLARMILQTWKRIPLGPRRRILNHWRCPDELEMFVNVPKPKHKPKPNDPFPFTLIRPRIELLSGWIGGLGDDIRTESEHRGELGAVFAHGHMLRFHAPMVDRIPDNLVCDLIAHELAHVWQYSIGLQERFGYEPDNGEVEEDADEIMGVWGFDATAMDIWATEQGITKVIHFDTVEMYLKSGLKHRYSDES